MKKGIMVAGLVTVAVVAGGAEQKYKPEWVSIKQHRTPEWFRDAKFGIYTHWGPVTLATADNMAGWYGNKLYQKDGPTAWTNTPRNDKPSKEYKYHLERWGDPKTNGYIAVINDFKPTKFDAEEWADIFEKAGARFAGPVGTHHDNFMMWDSDVTRWNVKRTTGIDVSGELEKAIRKRGMKFMMSFHHAFSWWYFAESHKYDGGIPGNEDLYTRPHTFSQAPDSFVEYPDAEYEDLWFRKLEEACVKYSPDLVWFDMGLELLSENIRKKAYARIFNLADERGQEIGLSYKIKYYAPIPPEAGILDYERGRSDKMREDAWLTDTSTGGWFYNGKPSRPAGELVDILVDIVSKNGCMLLNIGPKPDGSLPEDHVKTLLEIGEWLKLNGEAVYNTRPWVIAGEGPTKLAGGGHFAEQKGFAYTSKDIRFTRSKDSKVLYVTVLAEPDGDVVVKSLGKNKGLLEQDIINVRLVGSGKKVSWKMTNNGLVLPFTESMEGKYAWCYKIELSRKKAKGVSGKKNQKNHDELMQQ